MKTALVTIVTVCVLVGISGAVQLATPGDGTSQEYLSPHALAVDEQGSRLYVAAATSPRLMVVDPATEKVVGEMALPERASGLVLSPDASRLYVTTAAAQGRVYAVALPAGPVRPVADVGHTPNAPVLARDGKTLYVCNRYNHSVAVIDVTSGKTLGTIAVVREPIAAGLTPDGKLLVVANHLPAGRSDGDYVAAAVSIIDTATQKVAATINLPNGSTALQGLCISPDGRYAYVTHILGRYQLPTTQIERGWINTNALTIIDLEKKAWLNTVLLDDVDRGAANPCDVVCARDGKDLVVTLSGTHELCVIDREGLHGRLSAIAAGKKVSSAALTPDDVRDDLSFLVGLKRRLKLTGNGPRGLAVVGTKVFAAEYFTDSLAVVEARDGGYGTAKSIPLQTPVPVSEVRRGEMLFHDSRICFQQWQSCASCHPGAARADTLNWDLLNDGIGNPKNTKSLLLAHATPPSMGTGIRENAEVAVRSGIRYIQFSVRPEEEAVAIDTYLASLKPQPSPYLVDGQLSASALRGEKVFAQAGCAACHHGPHYTDLGQYDVGTGLGAESTQPFDTPTLIEIWRTGPYLHDGRAATIEDVFTRFNQKDEHGRTSGLSAAQIRDLADFVRTR